MDGNFDRVMALIGCVIGLEETHNKYTQEQEQSERVHEIQSILTNNKFLFPNSPPQDFTQLRSNQ